MHIGLIGGIGPAATEFYYRRLIDRHAHAGTVADLTIVHADVREMAANLATNAAQAQAESFARLLRRLAAPGGGGRRHLDPVGIVATRGSDRGGAARRCGGADRRAC